MDTVQQMIHVHACRCCVCAQERNTICCYLQTSTSQIYVWELLGFIAQFIISVAYLSYLVRLYVNECFSKEISSETKVQNVYCLEDKDFGNK